MRPFARATSVAMRWRISLSTPSMNPYDAGAVQPGVRCVWGSCVDGREVFLSLSTANSESFESCRDVLRALTMLGRQTPGTITTDGALGLIKAVDVVWPQSLR